MGKVPKPKACETHSPKYTKKGNRAKVSKKFMIQNLGFIRSVFWTSFFVVVRLDISLGNHSARSPCTVFYLPFVTQRMGFGCILAVLSSKTRFVYNFVHRPNGVHMFTNSTVVGAGFARFAFASVFVYPFVPGGL